MNKQNDLQYGFVSEERIHKFLEYHFGELMRTQDNPEMGKYFEFDKYNEFFFIEVKSRRYTHNHFPTLMFGENKYIKGEELKKENPNLRIFYVFKCPDKVVYWEHGTTEFSVKLSGRCDRGRDEYSQCVHIKTEHLKSFDDDSLFVSA